jgi:basic amino acid/polyamine antiporter, APA family
VSSGVQRRLGTADAAVLGLAAMFGTGVFAVWAPAAAAAGPWLLLAVVLAGLIAVCNAASTADLALVHPECSGGYGYGRERVTTGAGRLAGVAFLWAKSASAAAAAGVFGAYVLPSAPLPASILVIVVCVAFNVTGVRCTVRAAYALVGGILAVLLLVVVLGLSGTGDDVADAAPQVDPAVVPGGVLGVLAAAGFVFFAFAGHGRVARLGAEVRDPVHTLRRAIALALGIAMIVYVLVALALLVGLGADRLAAAEAPLVALVDSGHAPGLGVLVRVGAAVATGSALLSALVGTSRTALAMARRGELPGVFAALSSRGTPWRADLVGGVIAVVLVVFAGPIAAIAMSACALLVYYAVINLAALRLPADRRRWPWWTSALGLLLCLVLAVLLPTPPVLVTAAVLVVAWTACTVLPRPG